MHIEGLNNRYRATGIGAPLAADLKPIGDERGFQVARALKIPTTALLRLNISREAIAGGRFTGTLVLYLGNEARTVDINGQKVPLEKEPSAAFAYGLSNPTIWKSEIAGFLNGDLFNKLPSQLFALSPHITGRIPVVLIHGTASSAGRWADLINDLQNDPAISDRFEFWLFTYNTGNPIPLSALQLRTALRDAVNKLDPAGRDPALRKMVLVGHSQGGLLAKMQVIDSGSRLFDAISTKPLDDLKLIPGIQGNVARGDVRHAAADCVACHFHRHPAPRQLPNENIAGAVDRASGHAAAQRDADRGGNVDGQPGRAANGSKKCPHRQHYRHDAGQPVWQRSRVDSGRADGRGAFDHRGARRRSGDDRR